MEYKNSFDVYKKQHKKPLNKSKLDDNANSYNAQEMNPKDAFRNYDSDKTSKGPSIEELGDYAKNTPELSKNIIDYIMPEDINPVLKDFLYAQGGKALEDLLSGFLK